MFLNICLINAILLIRLLSVISVDSYNEDIHTKGYFKNNTNNNGNNKTAFVEITLTPLKKIILFLHPPS